VFPLLFRVTLRVLAAASCACLSLITVAGPSHAAVAAPAVAASSGTKVTLPSGSLGLQDLKKFADMIGWDGTGVVVVSGQSNLTFKPTDAGQDLTWQDVVNELASAKFAVLVSKPGPIGTAGALLYAMAKERVVVQGAVVPMLPKEVTGACAGSLCTALETHAISVTTRTPPADLADTVEFLPQQNVTPQGGGGSSPWLLIALIVAAIAALWFAGGNRVARRLVARPAVATGYGPGVPGVNWAGAGGPEAGDRDPGGVRGPRDGRDRPAGQVTRQLPATRYDAPPGGGRPALTRTGPVTRPVAGHGRGQGIVRTAMSPEGYVEIDGVLYRATWHGSRTAPRRGAVVTIVHDSNGELAVVEDGPVNGGSGPARP